MLSPVGHPANVPTIKPPMFKAGSSTGIEGAEQQAQIQPYTRTLQDPITPSRPGQAKVVGSKKSCSQRPATRTLGTAKQVGFAAPQPETPGKPGC